MQKNKITDEELKIGTEELDQSLYQKGLSTSNPPNN